MSVTVAVSPVTTTLVVGLQAGEDGRVHVRRARRPHDAAHHGEVGGIHLARHHLVPHREQVVDELRRRSRECEIRHLQLHIQPGVTVDEVVSAPTLRLSSPGPPMTTLLSVLPASGTSARSA